MNKRAPCSVVHDESCEPSILSPPFCPRPCSALGAWVGQITAVAQRDAHCYGLSRAHFMELMESYPKEMQELVDAAKSL